MKSRQELMEQIRTSKRDRKSYLEELFRCIPEDVAKEFQYYEINDGDRILLAGEPCDTVYILLDGEIKGLDYYKSGSVYSLFNFTKMCILGDFELYTEVPEYTISVFAKKPCRLLRISAKRYLKWVKNDENALFLRMKDILEILTMERKRDREYIRMGCKERVSHYLVIYYEKECENGSKETVKVAMTQAEISEKVGANVRSVQRAIAALEGEGLVVMDAGKMVISREQYNKMKDAM